MELLNRINTARRVAVVNNAKQLVVELDIAERVVKACYQVKFLMDMEYLECQLL